MVHVSISNIPKAVGSYMQHIHLNWLQGQLQELRKLRAPLVKRGVDYKSNCTSSGAAEAVAGQAQMNRGALSGGSTAGFVSIDVVCHGYRAIPPRPHYRQSVVSRVRELLESAAHMIHETWDESLTNFMQLVTDNILRMKATYTIQVSDGCWLLVATAAKEPRPE